MKMNRKGISITEMLITITIVLVIAFIVSPAGMWVPEKTAITALETQGFSRVKIIDRKWFMVSWRGCSKGDDVRFDASALNPAGKEIQISVCSGWFFKGATVRTI